MKKQYVRFVFCLCPLVVVLVACGGDSENTAPDPTPINTPITLPEFDCDPNLCANCNTLEGVECLGFTPEKIHDCFGNKECERGRFELVREMCFYEFVCF
jgi:hypothetical protein